MNTVIILTQTQLDPKLLVGYSLYLLTVIQSEDITAQQKTLLSMQEKGTLLLPQTEKKEDYKKLFTELYSFYPLQTFCYLGDLSTIDESAQEGMLKVLEEPPHNLTLVLSAQDLSGIKPTILSRSRVITVPTEAIPKLLDQNLIDLSKKYLPDYKSVIQELLSTKTTLIRSIDWKKVERDVLDSWLWQMSYYIELLLVQSPNHKSMLLAILSRVVLAKSLNHSNLQKKLVGEQLIFNSLYTNIV